MAVHLNPPHPADLHPIEGVRIGVTQAGIRKAGRKDLTVVLIDEGASVSGVFTQNRFCAAPVQVCREHLDAGQGIRAMVVNTGNANAGTGAQGLADARATCAALARALGVDPQRHGGGLVVGTQDVLPMLWVVLLHAFDPPHGVVPLGL